MTLASAGLGSPNCQGHGQTAADQNRGIDGAESDVELMTAEREGIGILEPVHDVGQEEATKEHDLGDQKDPHSEVRGLALLLEAIELMGESFYVPAKTQTRIPTIKTPPKILTLASVLVLGLKICDIYDFARRPGSMGVSTSQIESPTQILVYE